MTDDDIEVGQMVTLDYGVGHKDPADDEPLPATIVRVVRSPTGAVDEIWVR